MEQGRTPDTQQQPKARTARKKFKPWPKRTEGDRKVLDKGKVRDQYLLNPHFEWRAFCEDNGYNPDTRNQIFPIKSWQQDWLNQQIQVQDSAVIAPALKVRTQLLKRRLEYVETWGVGAGAAKEVAFEILASFQEITRSESRARKARYDQAKITGEAVVPVQSSIKVSDFATLATAMRTINELERVSLLIPPAALQQTVIPLPQITQDTREAEAEGEALKNMPMTVLGADGVPPAQMTNLLGQWFDQLKDSSASEELEKTEVTVEAGDGEAV